MQTRKTQFWISYIPWLLSLLLVCSLTWLILMLDSIIQQQDEEVEIRQIHAFVPPPPPPPPPIKVETTTETPAAPSINLLGVGEGPQMQYSDNPKLSYNRLEKIVKPEFNMNDLDIRKELTLDLPLFEVKELDGVPKLVSSNHISFPKELSRRGIDRVETKVEIIIDQTGRAYVKKIIDPVYPEMIAVIRKAINNSKFTIPLKNGQPVQAVYLYSLNFSLRI
jgi:protein TonB